MVPHRHGCRWFHSEARFAVCKTCYQTCTRTYRFDITALSACIFLPLLLYSGGVFPLPLQKPRLFYSSVKKDTASIAVRKQPSLYMYASSPYRRNWLWGKIMFYPNIFITLPLPIIFPSLIFFQIIFPIIRIQILYFTTYIIRYRCSPIINSLSFKFFYNVHLFFVFR